jgi:hypothetical protein
MYAEGLATGALLMAINAYNVTANALLPAKCAVDFTIDALHSAMYALHSAMYALHIAKYALHIAKCALRLAMSAAGLAFCALRLAMSLGCVKNQSKKTINGILNSLLFWKYYFCPYEVNSIIVNKHPAISELH